MSKNSDDTHPGVTSRLLCGGLLAIIGVMIPVFSYNGFLKPDGECLAIWFQRSGSIVVILAVGLEYILLKLEKNEILTGRVKPADKHPTQKLTPVYKALQLIAAILAVAGTVIWGYGDLAIAKT